jgi:CelD/BcsL family acetyltransferase involved in cellulose biosynthesis
VIGILPLFLVRGLYGRRLVSVPMRDRAGVVASSRAVMHALLRRAIALTGELDCRYLELKSLEPLDHDVASELGLRLHRHWITTRIDLTPGPEALWRALDRDFVRWAIGKARRSGVTVAVHEDPDGPELFHELFVRTRTAIGIPPFSPRLFRAIWQHLVSAGRANLFVARAGAEPINAMINFLSGDTFLPAYAAPQNAWRKSYPSETMFWATMEWAARQGFRRYDLGADSPEQEGLLAFKRKWGGVHHTMSTYYHLRGNAQPPVLDSSSRQYALARRVWAHLPAVVARPLGAWVTRQLS